MARIVVGLLLVFLFVSIAYAAPATADKAQNTKKAVDASGDNVETATTDTDDSSDKAVVAPAAKPLGDDKAASPAADKAASPATDKAAKPATDKAAKPATDKAASPATDKAAKPATDKAASPATDKAAKPATDKAAKPATDKATKPATDKAAGGDKSTNTTAENTKHAQFIKKIMKMPPKDIIAIAAGAIAAIFVSVQTVMCAKYKKGLFYLMQVKMSGYLPIGGKSGAAPAAE